MALRERYILVCGNKRPDDDPRGSCRGRCADLPERFKEALANRNLRHRFRALVSSCLDQCAFGPTVAVMPDNVWYRNVTPEDIAEIIDSHLLGGVPVERLRMPVASPPAPPRTPPE
jgi:(2Fe-2S) ferredoxin